MSLKLSSEDQNRAEKLIDSGRFSSIEELLHAGLQALDDDEVWRQYAQARIERGINDITEGRVISGDDFLAQLRKGRLTPA